MENLTAIISPMETRDKRITISHLAGFFDGEGTVYCSSGKVHKNGKREFSIQVFLTNTCKSKLEIIQQEYGGHVRAMKTLPGRKQLYRLEWWGGEADRILRILLTDPGLYIKRRQAELAIKFRELKPKRTLGQTPYSLELVDQLQRIASEIHFLNKRGVLAVAETKPSPYMGSDSPSISES